LSLCAEALEEVVTGEKFRKLALSFPEASEQAHIAHPDFRVGGKIFATLGPDEDWGMVKLTPNQQEPLVRGEPEVFQPASGAWGRRGATIVRLVDADESTVRQALIAAWRNTAPKRLIQQLDSGQQARLMRKSKSIVSCWLLLLTLCLSDIAGQRRVHYPKNADDITALVGVLSQLDFSVDDAIKRLGTVYSAKPDNFKIVLTPFPSEKDQVKGITLAMFDDTTEGRRKLDYVEINYIKPISISYGELRERYGTPGYIKPPVAKCGPRSVNCPPRFVGYRFSFLPDTRSLASGKSLEVAINLEMEWSKEVPQHTDKDFLLVKSLRCKRIWRVQERPPNNQARSTTHSP
jgi:hypothetical protein